MHARRDAADPMAAIRGTLAGVRRAARGWICLDSLAAAILVAAAGGWATLLVDRLVEPPAWARAALGAGVVAAVARTLVARLARRLAVPLDDESLALVVERTHPHFADSLSTAVSCGRDGDPVDPGMLEATLEAAAAGLPSVRAAAIFRRRRLAAAAAAAASALAVSAWAAWARPADAAAWMRRMVLLSDTAWPRRVALEPDGFVGGRRVVARGDDVDVTVLATAAWGDPPDVIELRTRGSAAWRTVRMGGRGLPSADGQRFGHVLERVTEDLELDVRGGDARVRGLRLLVAEPPAVESVAISVTPPAYLGGAPQNVPASRVVAVPAGSVLDLAFTATGPLAAATIAVRRAAGDAAAETIASLAAEGATGVTGRTPPLDAESLVLVRLVDRDGLSNREPVALIVAPVADEPPRLALRLAGISAAVTPLATLPIEGSIADDHGLDAAVVRVSAGDTVRERPIERVAAGSRDVEFPPERPELVSLTDLGVSVGGRLELSVSARDRCGTGTGPNVATGDTWTLDVVAPEALLAVLEAREVLLRRRLEAAIDELRRARDAAEPAAARPGDESALRRCGDAATRVAGEAAEIASEFRGIHRELANNALATRDRETRLVGQIAMPLEAIAGGELQRAILGCREAVAGDGRRDAVAAVDAAVARLREVLDRMLELETMNEVLERLRGLIGLQEEIRADTLQRQRRRGREALEAP